MRKMVYGLLLGAAGFATLPGPAAAAPCNSVAGNLIVNCGFETGDFTGWTLSGNPWDLSVQPSGTDGYPANSGNFFALAGAVGSLGFLSQTVADTAGAPYTVSLYFSSDGLTPNELDVEWDGTTLFNQTNIAATRPNYTQSSFSVTGTGSDTLAISERNDPGFLAIDDVSVSPAVVVEPATLSILGAALATLGLVRRHRRSCFRRTLTHARLR